MANEGPPGDVPDMATALSGPKNVTDLLIFFVCTNARIPLKKLKQPEKRFSIGLLHHDSML
jgi:hypothetical protein